MIQENLYTPDCIRTFTGLYINVFEPTPEMICIEDIAHALAQHYSVGQHSINCAHLSDTWQEKLEALLHDASEAYLGDMPSPIKKRLPDYKVIEHKLMGVIANKFGFQYPLSDNCKAVDESLLHGEWHYLMLKNESWKFPIFSELKTETRFLECFNVIKSKLNNVHL